MTAFIITATVFYSISAMCNFIIFGKDNSGTSLVAGIIGAGIAAWGLALLMQ